MFLNDANHSRAIRASRRGWTRRQVLAGMAASGLLGAFRWSGVALASGQKPSLSPFEPDRRKALAAATERILPGAIAAGVPEYLDYWMVRHPFDRYVQKLFKVAAIHLDRLAQKLHKRAFPDCTGEQQDAILRRFQTGEIQAKAFDSKAFFEHLVRFTMEGFLGDPKYGGNRDQTGWKFMGRKECWWQPRHLELITKPGQGLPY